MKHYTLGWLALSAFALSVQAQPAKLKRVDSFFGIHMDHHAVETESETGKTLTVGLIDSLLRVVKPDFIQVDCKGHPGITSYPTAVGNRTQSYVGDPLDRWREVTRRHGVSLYVHYSGVWDSKVCSLHPDWAIRNKDGKPSPDHTSFYSPYEDRILIPQLKELSDKGIDGAWIDGDCWAVNIDYSPAAQAEFKQVTGLDSIPTDRKDPHYMKAVNFFRTKFFNYVNKYVEAIHAYNPRFQITSNWIYSSLAPYPPDVPVDFLSGDVTPRNSVNSAAFEARCMAGQGKPWDLMMWSFSWDGAHVPMNTKSGKQLEQELAEIMAMGGGVQVYFRQNTDISFSPWEVNLMGELSAFCRKYQPYCFKAKPVPQVAILNSTAFVREKSTGVFGNGYAEPIKGLLTGLLDNQYSTEILLEHQIKDKMSDYPLLVVPQFDTYEPSFVEKLRRYVRDGGNLLVVGVDAARSFSAELGITESNEEPEASFYLPYGDKMGATRSRRLFASFNAGVQPLCESYSANDFRYSVGYPLATVTSYGKGKVAGIYFDLGTANAKYKAPVMRELLHTAISKLTGPQMVEIRGSHLVHQTTMTKEGKTMINLINVGGNHENINATGYDEVPPLRNLEVILRLKKSPAKITLQPGNKPVEFRQENGVCRLKLEPLDIYSILVVE